ncbi:probable insulin-like peptide 5 [Drosophila rhopaloa]|uniref:Probable insulin-like peptide 5 n=1 Tax=Drosophila rhopaloa TaxID=1041015 RepID=A0A6P4E5G8_DRORH|nr:probable insulin-like peptide 5 [Drosophila rhopaloa]
MKFQIRSLIPLLVILIPLLKPAEGELACGHYLTELVMTVCEGKLNVMISKRAYPDLNLFGFENNMLENSDSEEDFKPHHPRLNSMMAMPRNLRGIVDECCHRPCSVKKIQSYCQD